MSRWSDLSGIDRRLAKALSKLGYVSPTVVQSECIPLALLGKDVLVKARTGSGKTVAFAIPLLQKVLNIRDADPDDADGVKCLVLVPTKELCKQAEKVLQDLTYYCRESISISSIDGDLGATQKKTNWDSKADVIVATPGSLEQLVDAHLVALNKVKCMVIDEADLVLSFGYQSNMVAITAKMPKIYQGIMVSATLSSELDNLSKSILHNPILLDIKEEVSDSQKLQQFYLETTEDEKFLVLFVFLKLGLLKGKGIIFVNDVNKCYRLKLFLQQFYLTAAVISSEVPFNSRLNMLQEFNQGVFDYLIATDKSFNTSTSTASSAARQTNNVGSDDDDGGRDKESGLQIGSGDEKSDSDNDDEEDDDAGDNSDDGDENNSWEEDGNEGEKDEEEDSDQKEDVVKEIQTNMASSKDDDFGVSRGVDFVGVSFVINFDFPETVESYAHRIGRTARSTAFGTSLSFVISNESSILYDVRQAQPHAMETDHMSVLNALTASNVNEFDPQAMEESRKQPKALSINTKELDGFRYRVEDTLRSVTATAVKEFRTAELKREVMNSAALKDYFTRNPNELKILRHDKSISHPIRRKEHLHNVPKYLIPASMRGVATNSAKKGKKRKHVGGTSADKRISNAKTNDPLSDASAIHSSTDNTNAKDEIFESEGGPGVVLGKNQSTSGRKSWQATHKKGSFGKKKNAHRVAGSFTKPKKPKS